jgi:hypothetical protein
MGPVARFMIESAVAVSIQVLLARTTGPNARPAKVKAGKTIRHVNAAMVRAGCSNEASCRTNAQKWDTSFFEVSKCGTVKWDSCRARKWVIVSASIHAKATPPSYVCTVCGKVGYNFTLTNGRCGQQLDGKRCRGINQSAILLSDWAECPTCDGGGGAVRCFRCDGAGWIFVRAN